MFIKSEEFGPREQRAFVRALPALSSAHPGLTGATGGARAGQGTRPTLRFN